MTIHPLCNKCYRHARGMIDVFLCDPRSCVCRCGHGGRSLRLRAEDEAVVGTAEVKANLDAAVARMRETPGYKEAFPARA